MRKSESAMTLIRISRFLCEEVTEEVAECVLVRCNSVDGEDTRKSFAIFLWGASFQRGSQRINYSEATLVGRDGLSVSAQSVVSSLLSAVLCFHSLFAPGEHSREDICLTRVDSEGGSAPLPASPAFFHPPSICIGFPCLLHF